MNEMRRVLASCSLPLALLGAALLISSAGGPSANAARAADSVRSGRAHAWLAELQRRFPDRSVGRDEHRDAPEYLRAALGSAGADDAHVETLATGIAWLPHVRNVIATVPGGDPSRSIVLAAHHDTVGGAPGAIDDGGAIAVLVEVAHALAAGPRPACDIEFAVFDGEESGLLGLSGSVAGVLCGVPLVTGAAAALAVPRRFRLAPLLVAAAPMLVQVMLMTAAATAFGLRWRGGVLHGVLLALLGAASVATIILVRLHRPPRERYIPRSSRATQLPHHCAARGGGVRVAHPGARPRKR